MIWVQNQLIGAYEGQRMTLECHSEAFPQSINYWTREKGEIVPQGKLRNIFIYQMRGKTVVITFVSYLN